MPPRRRRHSQGSTFISRMIGRIPRPYRKIVLFTVVLCCLFLVYEFFSIGRRTRAEPDIPVVVVEEHHEVLPHWFEAANSGLFPKSGNTLIHIDGHSDMAPTMYFEGYPDFRWPKNDKEITYMLQSNDVFIMAATTSGMFDKVIWVWPKWDSVNHDDIRAEAQWEFGFYKPNQKEGKKSKAFCECLTNPDNPEDKRNNRCNYLDREQMETLDEESRIPHSKCDIRSKSKIIESLETDFLNILSNSMIDPHENIVLDIDEDYFGCESGTTEMISKGIPWRVLQQINAFLALTICPKTTEHEKEGDTLLTGLIKIIIKKCKREEQCEENKMFNLAAVYMEKHRKEKKSGIFCRGKKSTSYFIKLITRRLLRMTKEQLKILIDVGFCSSTSPKSYREPQYDENEFRVCHGFNTPNESVVIFHSPDQNEINMRMNLLDQIIQHPNFPTPKLVTVCRSMRDGYTPKGWFHEIEKGVLETVRRKLGNSMALKYDIDLLGGSSGWPGRHNIWLDRL